MDKSLVLILLIVIVALAVWGVVVLAGRRSRGAVPPLGWPAAAALLALLFPGVPFALLLFVQAGIDAALHFGLLLGSLGLGVVSIPIACVLIAIFHKRMHGPFGAAVLIGAVASVACHLVLMALVSRMFH